LRVKRNEKTVCRAIFKESKNSKGKEVKKGLGSTDENAGASENLMDDPGRGIETGPG